jgi:hypothetical protein
MSIYRTGNHNPRNIYRVTPSSNPFEDTEDEHVGVMFAPDDGPMAAEALNRMHGATNTAAQAEPPAIRQYLIRAFAPNFSGDVVPSHSEGDALLISYVFAPDEQEAARAFHASQPGAVIRDLWQLMPPGYLAAGVLTPDQAATDRKARR